MRGPASAAGRMGRLAAVTLAAFGLAGLGPVAGAPEDLVQAGDRAARAGRYVEALTDWKQAFEGRFPVFRGQSFRFPVAAEFLGRDGLRARLLEELDKEVPEAEFLAQQKVMVAFGFIPAGIALRQTVVELLTQEIAGFYDPDTKRLYLIREERAATESHWLDRLLGGDFDPSTQKALLAHEMSHALMDQHHDLLSLQRSVKDDDDMSLALSALVEGEATLAMFVVPDGNLQLLTAPPAAMDFAMQLATSLVYFAGSRAFQSAPRVLKETLLFPYLKGLTFCMSLTEAGGSWSPVDRAFSAPPLSTEMILHPEKYGADLPTRLSFPDLLPALGNGWRAVHANVLGELQVRILLSEGPLGPGQSAASAAEGWDGDFYRLYETTEANPAGTGKTLLAWASTWDSEKDALELARAYAAFLSGRKPLRLAEAPVDASGTRSWRAHYPGNGMEAAVLQRGADVWVVDGVPTGSFEAVTRTVTRLERQVKDLRLRRVRPKVPFPPR